MPLLGFKKQFAPMVACGLMKFPTPGIQSKRQTIRAKRRDMRNPHPGETLYLYVGLRTKGCRKLGEAICKSVDEITIDDYGVNVSGRWLVTRERREIAQADGFDCFQCMLDFFRKEHELPFSGLLIKW